MCLKEERPLENIDLQKLRIIQETVPGKQITLAHVIANPDQILFQKLGLNPKTNYDRQSIGIITMTPSETAESAHTMARLAIAADIAMKTSTIDLGFVDRFSGTLILTGKISQVESSITAVANYVRDVLDFTVCPITKT